MRINLNLATRPYRDVRQFLMTWGLGTALLAVVTLALVVYAAVSWRQSRTSREQTAQIRQQIEKLDRERADAVAMLNQPQNVEVVSRAAFLNDFIARRSFSWTRLFMELERIVPPRLHVVSIAPSLNKNNQIEIRMVVGGDAREPAVELVQRLERSPSFRQAQLRSEVFATPGSTGDKVQFEISTLFVPSAEADKAEQQPAAKQENRAQENSARPQTLEAKR